jgi:hypothetical protein
MMYVGMPLAMSSLHFEPASLGILEGLHPLQQGGWGLVRKLSGEKTKWRKFELMQKDGEILIEFRMLSFS